MTGVEVELEQGHASSSGHMEPGPYVPIQFDSDDPYGTASARPAKKTPIVLPLAIVFVLASLAVVSATVFVSKGSKSAPTFQDLGAGISNATGLKGKLQVRWQGSAQYQLKIEPIDPLQSSGFSFVAANPRPGMLINVRILDATGFAVCNKEIVFSPEGRAKGSDQDAFQNVKGETGKVVALNAQGTLPCTADQFRQANYWDFSTNFPTLGEQEALMRQTAFERARREAAAKAAAGRVSSGFLAEGDDGAALYDAGPGVLQTRLGRNFFIAHANDRITATTWAANSSVFHYKCDQHSRCALTRSGGGQTIYVAAVQ